MTRAKYQKGKYFMSLVQIANQTILTRLRDWSKLDDKECMEVMEQASSLMGQNFRVALYILEESPHRVIIEDYEMFFSLILDGEKFLLFKSNSRARLNDCTCKSSWERKTGEKAPYMCIHQILLELVMHIFQQKVSIDRQNCQGTAQLAELLDIIQ